MNHGDTETRREPSTTISVRAEPDGKVWLQHRDGEGGMFDAAEVDRVRHDAAELEAWFWRHF